MVLLRDGVSRGTHPFGKQRSAREGGRPASLVLAHRPCEHAHSARTECIASENGPARIQAAQGQYRDPAARTWMCRVSINYFNMTPGHSAAVIHALTVAERKTEQDRHRHGVPYGLREGQQVPAKQAIVLLERSAIAPAVRRRFLGMIALQPQASCP